MEFWHICGSYAPKWYVWLSKFPNLFWFSTAPSIPKPFYLCHIWDSWSSTKSPVSSYVNILLQRRALRPGYALRTLLPIILDQSLEIDHFLIFLIAPIHWQFKQFNSSLPLSHLYHSWWLQPLQEWSIQPVGILSSCLPPFQRSFFLYTAFCSSPFSMTSS